VLNLKDNQFHN